MNTNTRGENIWIISLFVVWLFCVYYFTSNITVYEDIKIDNLQEKLAEIEYNANNKDIGLDINKDLYQDSVTKIIIHHTATPADQDSLILYNAIQTNHAKRWKRGGIEKVWQQMMYHRLVWTDWRVFWDKSYDEIWRGTKENNLGSIHIALQWDFNKTEPTEEQYKEVEKLIEEIRKKYWNDIKILWHGELDLEHTWCPWKKLDMERIIGTKKEETIDLIDGSKKQETEPMLQKKDRLILFSLSRYYSPMQWQKKYYANRTYEADVTMNCWASAIWNNGCLYPASWIEYTNENKNKSVACPKEYPIGTKIELVVGWGSIIVTCEDRWSAIIKNRLDMYCWLGMWALDNWDTCVTWKRYWKVIE